MDDGSRGEKSVEWKTTLRKLWNQWKRDRFSAQFSKKEFDGWKEAERYKSFRKRTSADVIRFQEGRSTAEPVADDEKKKLKIDFRVQGIHQDPLDHREIRHIIHPVFCDYKGIAPWSSLWEDCCAARKPPSEDVFTERSQAQWHRESQQAFGWTCAYICTREKKDISCIAPERWAGKSSSNFPSHHIRQRPFQERQWTLSIWSHLSSSSAWKGSQSWWNFRKLATNEFIFHTRSFAYRTLWFFCKRLWV